MTKKESIKKSVTEPSELKNKTGAPDWLFANITEASKSARKIYFLYIGFLFYCALTVIGTSDRNIVLNEKVHLPLFNVDVLFYIFILTAPLISIFIFIYLQLYLGRIKWLINVSFDYAVIEKGRLYPWMFNFPEDPDSSFTKGIQKIIVKFSLWGMLPLVLGLFALWAIRTHEPFHSYSVGIMPILGASVVLLFWFRYDGIKAKPLKFILKNLGKFILSFIMILFELTLLLEMIPKLKQGEYLNLVLNREKLITEPTADYEGIYWGHFAGKHLEGAELISSILKRADLRKAQLQKANLREAILQGADLYEADLEGADLSGADLSGANLSLTTLQDAKLSQADLYEADLYRANLLGAILPCVDLQGANVSVANLRGAIVYGSVLAYANLQGANLQGADLSETDLQGARLFGVNFEGANLSEADLRETIGLSIEQLSEVKTLFGTQLDQEIMELIKKKHPHLLKKQIRKIKRMEKRTRRMEVMDDDILAKEEASAYLKISVTTLDRLMKEKKIPYSKINGRVLFLKEDLLKWVKSKRVK